MTPLTAVDRRRLSDIAFDRLKEAVIRGEIAPLEKIRDVDLAERLGLSRTPVREALTRLVEIGLAESRPGVHTRISGLTREDVAMTLDVLQSLDGLAVRSAVPRLRSDEILRMRSANEAFARAVESGDFLAALAADNDFHRVLYEASGNPVLIRVISQLDPHVQRIMYRKLSTTVGSQNTSHHHESLVDLCTRGDADQAATLSSSQWSALGGQIADLFPPGPDGEIAR